MGMLGADYTQGESLHKDLKDRFRPLANAGLPLIFLGTALVVDLPDLVIGIGVIALVLAILAAIHLAFSVSKSFLSGIWVVGSTLVAGLEHIDTWVQSLFTWVDDVAINAAKDVAQHIINTGQLVVNYFTYGLGHSIIILFQDITDTNAAVSNVNNYAHTQVNSMQAQIDTNRHTAEQNLANTALNLQQNINQVRDNVNTFESGVSTLIANMQQQILNEIANRQLDEATIMNDITNLQTYIGQETTTLSDKISAIETRLQSDTNTIAQEITQLVDYAALQQGVIGTQQGEITTEQTQIGVLQQTTVTHNPTIDAILGLSAIGIANLLKLAEDPCFCLSPIGGLATIEALIAGLEVGIL